MTCWRPQAGEEVVVKLSILFPEVSNIDRAVERILRLEALGFHSAMMGYAFGFDPLVVFALAGQRTERILLTSAVVPTYSRHPIAMAMAAAARHCASAPSDKTISSCQIAHWLRHTTGTHREQPTSRRRPINRYIQAARSHQRPRAT